MLTLAAIWYNCDQDEPSEPFFLDLPDCSEQPTLAELCNALQDWYYQRCAEDYKQQRESDPEDDTTIESTDIVVDTAPGWGHFGVSHNKDLYPSLFATI